MAIYPKAIWKPISVNYTRTVTNKNALILHTTASTATSQFGWFSNKSAMASSHFHIANDGTIEQYIDTKYISWASGDANSRSVSIETQGTGKGVWTNAQVKALGELSRWICAMHGIPVQQMTSSKATSRGIGWHRLGIDGNFPKTGILRGRSARGGGQSWSSAYGKECPGDARIKQVPGIIKSIKGGKVTPVGAVPPKTSTPVKKKVWPFYKLAITGTHNSSSHNAYIHMLAGVGYSNSSLTVSIQEWLRDLGYYHGVIDGVFGELTAKALQSFLKDKGFYTGVVDGVRGPLTVKAEKKYINYQTKFFK